MTTTKNKRQFSTASIRVFADKIDPHLNPNAVDSVLNTLANLDQQIHDDFNAVQRELAGARQENSCISDALKRQQDVNASLHRENDSKNRQIDILTRQLSELQLKAQSPPLPSDKHTPPETAQLSLSTMTLCSTAVCDCRPPSNAKSPRFFTVDHAHGCSLRQALVHRSTSHDLCDLLLAREDACRNQQILINRLKEDNKQLKTTYDSLWGRYQLLYENHREKDTAVTTLNDRIEHLSARVQNAGQAAVEVATKVEERLKITARDVNNFRKSFTHSTSPMLSPVIRHIQSPLTSIRSIASSPEEDQSFEELASAPTPPRASTKLRHLRDIPDEYDTDPTLTEVQLDACQRPGVGAMDEAEGFTLVTDELMRTMALQQDAHEKLRATVLELTEELNRIDPNVLNDVGKYKQQLQTAESKLEEFAKKIASKDQEILDLRRQLTKVIAEYEAISVAHSYSNAELSKIRANNREKTKNERQAHEHRLYPRGHLVLEGVENRHHRKIHFR